MRIYVDTDSTGSVISCGTTPIGVSPVEVEVEDWMDVFEHASLYRLSEDGTLSKDGSLQLEYEKKLKDLELNQACKEAILGGFYHTIDEVEYFFSFDTEAQLNFQGAERLLSNGVATEIMWTVQRDGEYTRVPINKEVMDGLSLAILLHKDRNVSKYRDTLLPKVKTATTIEEVQAVAWENDPAL